MFVQSLKLRSITEWNEYCSSGKRPANIPQKPSRTYKGKGWKSFGDFFGTNNIASNKINFRSLDDAKKFAQSLKLNGSIEWFKYFKSVNRPFDIPYNPRISYKNKGWKGWPDFLGKK